MWQRCPNPSPPVTHSSSTSLCSARRAEAMEVSSIPRAVTPSCRPFKGVVLPSTLRLINPDILGRASWIRHRVHGCGRRASKSVRAIEGFADLPPVEITWQIAVGALAGITPFVVAGIEFSKRIVAQRRCEVCGGSGLVQRDGYHARCPGCGGFLPWQSWKRFFTG